MSTVLSRNKVPADAPFPKSMIKCNNCCEREPMCGDTAQQKEVATESPNKMVAGGRV